MVEMDAFHTCKKNGSEHNAPFLSRPKHQWLTQGYYFWTDSDHFAKKWGEPHYKNSKYCIYKCILKFEKGELLDLVGNVGHKIYFLKSCEKIRKTLKNNQISLSAIIEYLRGIEKRIPGAFAYKAIKAEDKRDLELQDIPVTKGSKELITIGPTRQQLCLFENGYNAINNGAIQ